MSSNLEQEVNQMRRARNWAAIVAMGKGYKTFYLIVAVVALIAIAIGFLTMNSSGGTLLIIGLGLGVVVNGGMTLIANAKQTLTKNNQDTPEALAESEMSSPYANLCKLISTVSLLASPGGTTIKVIMSRLCISRRSPLTL